MFYFHEILPFLQRRILLRHPVCIIHKIIGRIIGGWGSKHCSSFVRLALSMSEINENVFNIEIICYLRKSYPAFKLFFIVSNHFFFTQSNYLKQTSQNLTQTEIHDITFVQAIPLFKPYLCSFRFRVLSRLSYPAYAYSSCSVIFNTLAYRDSNQSFARYIFRHIHTPINHLQDLGISRLWSIVCKIWAYPDFDQSFTRFAVPDPRGGGKRGTCPPEATTRHTLPPEKKLIIELMTPKASCKKKMVLVRVAHSIPIPTRLQSV